MEQLFKTSLPTYNEEKIINYINNMNRNNRKKAQIFAFTNSLVLAENGIDSYQLDAMLIKDYIFNSKNGKTNKIVELEELDKLINAGYDNLNKDYVMFLIQYLEVDDCTRYLLAKNFIKNIDNKSNRFAGIRSNDIDYCIQLGNELNNVIENKLEKKDVKVYTVKSNR